MYWLGRVFRVLPLEDAVRRLQAGTLPARAAAITFDDGYADNHDVAMPILRRFGLTATFFIASGFVDGGRMWNDTVIETVRRWRGETLSCERLGVEGLPTANNAQRLQAISALLSALKHRAFAERAELANALAREVPEALPSPMMSSEEVCGLHRAGMGIGGHTRWHPILSVLSEDEARAEILAGKEDLEGLLDRSIETFAYPNGRPQQDYCERHSRMVRELGFAAAVTTAWGAARSGVDPYQLPRFTPWDHATLRFLARLAYYRHKSIGHSHAQA